MSCISPTVSITIVLYNSAKGLRECLRSIRPTVLSGFAEVLLVDNASPDDSAAIATTELPEAVLLRSPSNRGFAGGCNYSYPYVRTPYWLLLNPDVVVPPSGIEQLIEWLHDHSRIGAASPNIIDRGGGQWCPGRRYPSIAMSLLELSRLHLFLPRRLRGRWLQGHYLGSGDHQDVDFVPGAALVVRREVAERVGLLSEAVLMYGEDSEWCWRIRQAGWQIGVCGGVSFVHDEGQSGLQTWGAVERTNRIWAGLYDSCRSTKGNMYTRILIAIQALAFAVEAIHPRRSPRYRQTARGLLRAHLALLCSSTRPSLPT